MSELSTDALAEALRPIVAALVAEELARQLPAREPDEEPPYWTAAQYAERHRTTPAAVRARCRRDKVPGAFKPPGSDGWLIPTGSPDGNGAEERAHLTRQQKSPGDAGTSRGVTPGGNPDAE
jgi:hypothetical protein